VAAFENPGRETCVDWEVDGRTGTSCATSGNTVSVASTTTPGPAPGPAPWGLGPPDAAIIPAPATWQSSEEELAAHNERYADNPQNVTFQ